MLKHHLLLSLHGEDFHRNDTLARSQWPQVQSRVGKLYEMLLYWIWEKVLVRATAKLQRTSIAALQYLNVKY